MSRSRSPRLGLRLTSLVSLALLGCVSPSGTRTVRPQKELYQIQRTEIEAAANQLATAYDIVYRLRPSMLSRQVTSAPGNRAAIWQAQSGVKVYLDGIPYGGVQSLTTISANVVRDVRWLSPLDATTRYGTGNAAGAILITTLTGRR